MSAQWYEPGVTPTPGKRYEFEDFVGARFVGTLAGWESVDMEDIDGHLCRGVSLTFTDRCGFETNLPIRFRDAEISA